MAWKNDCLHKLRIATSIPSPRSCALLEFLPRALYERFHIEVLATTDSPLDSLEDHRLLRESGRNGPRILPTFRPDAVVDPEFAGFRENVAELGRKDAEDTSTWTGYLHALQKARFSSRPWVQRRLDHGHPTAHTADLSPAAAAKLFAKILSSSAHAQICRAVSQADVDRNGPHEPEGRLTRCRSILAVFAIIIVNLHASAMVGIWVRIFLRRQIM